MSQSLIAYLNAKLPEICKVRDLVKIGLYSSPQSAYTARKKGMGPTFVHVPQSGYIYYKKDIISFIKSLQGYTSEDS